MAAAAASMAPAAAPVDPPATAEPPGTAGSAVAAPPALSRDAQRALEFHHRQLAEELFAVMHHRMVLTH